ncbi:MAG: hypothetical protein WCV62_05420 [Candidatus Peribacteraceae bacterium]|jgi:hypothetical protein
MPSVQNTYDSLEKLNAEAVEAVAAIIALYQEALEEDPDVGNGEFAAEVAALWDAAADEHGWNPAHAARMARGIVELCKQEE